MTDETKDKVLAIISNLKKKEEPHEQTPEDVEINLEGTTENVQKKNVHVIKGRPKSGRFWKDQKEKFSTINKTKGLRASFEKKTALRLELKQTKEHSKQIQEELKQKEAERKERRRQNIKRSEENKRKAEVVQVITNTAKLRRMKKKQLRFIQKRDTNKEVDASK